MTFWFAGYLSGHSNSIILKSRLAYTDQDNLNTPKVMAANYQERNLYCNYIKTHKFDGNTYDCSPQVLLVLYSIHHDHYLLNILIPHHRDDTNERINRNFGRIKDVYITVSKPFLIALNPKKYTASRS